MSCLVASGHEVWAVALMARVGLGEPAVRRRFGGAVGRDRGRTGLVSAAEASDGNPGFLPTGTLDDHRTDMRAA